LRPCFNRSWQTQGPLRSEKDQRLKAFEVASWHDSKNSRRCSILGRIGIASKDCVAPLGTPHPRFRLLFTTLSKNNFGFPKRHRLDDKEKYRSWQHSVNGEIEKKWEWPTRTTGMVSAVAGGLFRRATLAKVGPRCYKNDYAARTSLRSRKT